MSGSFTPSEFVFALNDALEMVYPAVIIEGEVANYRLSRQKWVYFDLIDQAASVKFFGTIYGTQSQLEDGMMARVLGVPKLSPQYGFSLQIKGVELVGQGALQKAQQALERKLASEGLFAQERKRPVPQHPQRIGLVTSVESAAYSDFVKIVHERTSGVEIIVADCLVQGAEAPEQIVAAIDRLQLLEAPPEVLVVTRGGGSTEDLQAFSTEQVVRAVAASRIPTVVAIGHERDISLAELAADWRASTPSNAAERVTRDKQAYVAQLHRQLLSKAAQLEVMIDTAAQQCNAALYAMDELITGQIELAESRLNGATQTLTALDPQRVLRRGYAMVRSSTNNSSIPTASLARSYQRLILSFTDGDVPVIVQEEGANK